MAQYDLHIIQNVHPTGLEFSEKQVNIAKGGLLSANASQVPEVLPAGTNGYQLVRDDAEATGLKWVAITSGHTQGTDTGTTSTVFGLDTDGYDIELTAESASKAGVKVSGGATYADLQAKDATFNKVTVGSASPSGAYELTHKTYVDALFAANDAMLFKGTIGTGGTLTIAAFNALTTYNAGWTYRVIEAGTVRGEVVGIGDIVMVVVDRTGSGNTNADFTFQAVNIEGIVVGPASATDNGIALFDGTTGKLIKSSAAVGTMAYEVATNYVAKSLYDANSILYATTDNTPAALTIGEQTVLGRITGGAIEALTPVKLANILCVTAPSTKTSSGTAGQIAFDANYLYRCTATNSWTRAAMATNW